MAETKNNAKAKSPIKKVDIIADKTNQLINSIRDMEKIRKFISTLKEEQSKLNVAMSIEEQKTYLKKLIEEY